MLHGMLALSLYTSLYISASLLYVQIHAENVVGAADSSGTVRFSHTDAGRARLEDCTIRNQGIDRSNKGNGSNGKAHAGSSAPEASPETPCFWKRKVPRAEACRIVLRGRSEFVARSVEITGDVLFEVLSGQRMEVCC